VSLHLSTGSVHHHERRTGTATTQVARAPTVQVFMIMPAVSPAAPAYGGGLATRDFRVNGG